MKITKLILYIDDMTFKPKIFKSESFDLDCEKTLIKMDLESDAIRTSRILHREILDKTDLSEFNRNICYHVQMKHSFHHIVSLMIVGDYVFTIYNSHNGYFYIFKTEDINLDDIRTLGDKKKAYSIWDNSDWRKVDENGDYILDL